MRKILRDVLILSCLMGAAVTVRAEALNFAAGFGWKGYVDTDLTFAQFFDHDHTIVLRFLPQYTMVAEAPMIALAGTGNYALGLGAYRAGGKNAVKLELAIGSRVAFYSRGNPAKEGDPVPLEGGWHTLAVVRRGSTFVLFLDGMHLPTDAGGDLTPTTNDLASLSGKVRLGRRAVGDAPQFYGLLDDLAVFGRALTKAELDSLFQRKRLDRTAIDLGLIQAWTFDSTLPAGGPLPASFNHPPTFHLPAYKALVSQKREDALDVKFLPPTFQASAMDLPFAPGVPWKVEQGNQGLLSHNDTAAFSWDFIRDDPHHHLDLSETCGTHVFAITDGKIRDGCDLGDPADVHHLETGCASSAAQFQADGILIDGYDFMRFEVTPDEVAVYLHLQKGSLREAFPGHAGGFKSPVTSPPPVNIPVQAGRVVGRAGTRQVDGKSEHDKPNNCHLHFSFGKNGVTTFPIAFRNYEYFEEGFARWLPMDRGIPRINQWIRRPAESVKPPKPSPRVEDPCICPDGTKAGPKVRAGSPACEHICRGHERH